jgi:putative membrane protein
MQWLLAFHIISIVMWFAGLFYLPRLFVYHSITQDELGDERFKIMEKKLFLLLFSGFLLFREKPDLIFSGWFQLKLALVLSLVMYHFYCGHVVKIFRENKNSYSHIFYRWLNEYPTVILIMVVILAMTHKAQ